MLLAVLLLVMAGCTRGEDGQSEQTEPAERTEQTEEPEASPSRSASPSPSPALDARYYEDSDGNIIPDFLEVELGYDPLVDDCALQAGCPGVDELEGSPLTTEQNTLLLLDSSGSMAGPDPSGRNKMEAARGALQRYVVGTPDSFNLGLEVFGHRGSNDPSGQAESCAGIDVFAPLGALDVASVDATLQQFQPTGYTPIAGALDRAAQEFAGREGQANRIILVSDGIETCDGDPVAAALRLKQAGIAVTVDVVGFDVAGGSDQNALRAIAEATGGTYTNAADATQLDSYFDSLVQRHSDLIGAIACVQSNQVSAVACSQSLAVSARERLTSEGITAGTARREALTELGDRIWEYDQQLAGQITSTTNDRIAQLQAELDEVNRRYQERFGRPASASLICPAQQSGPVLLG